MDLNKSPAIENVPPEKKLKQATLNFFKPTPTSSGSSGSRAKKRKNTNSPAADLPNKSAKLVKPLIVRAEPPNSPSKQTNVSKTSVELSVNDQEVSSSSEADSGSSSKSNYGRCCLMERFVCKLPKPDNQEISSTNDCVDAGLKNKEVKDKDEDDDCIVLNDDSCEKASTEEKTTKAKTPEPVKHEETATSHEEHVKDSCETQGCEKDVSPAEKKNSEGAPTESDKADNCLDTSVDNAQAEVDVHNESILEGSFISDCSVVITPCKSKEITKECLDTSFNSSILSDNGTDKTESLKEDGTPSDKKVTKTPASGKKGRKVDLAKKAEKEAQKQKLKEEKELERSAKKRKLEEEKAEKERLKREQKEAKEREKEELREKQLKEKLEKEKLKEEERKQKEEERLAKEEEKKKKQAALEAKQEEKRKRDEEKRLKEEEKQREEEEKRKKAEKTKQAFQSFFIKPKETQQKPVAPKVCQGFFSPFELKKDMHLAPAVRLTLSDQSKASVDQALQSCEVSSSTYLKVLKSGTHKPHRTGKVLRINPKPAEDVEMVHDPKALQKVQHKVKLLQFYTDYRPPYYGTWRKSPKLNPRKPWSKDESFFDYEVDSDDEWEEEEPGESLSCSDGDEDKGEKGEDDENEDEEDGWMVPHGYLSEDEGCNEDDEISPEKLKLQQLAKAKAWELEQKKKLQAAPVIAVGCFYEHSPSALMAGDVRLLYEFRGVLISGVEPIPTSLYGSSEINTEEPTTPDKSTTTPQARSIKMTVPDEAMPDLIRLVHGNVWGLKRLVREFRIFWFKKETSPETNLQSDMKDKSADTKEKLDTSIQDKEKETAVLNDSVLENIGEQENKKSEGGTDENKEEDGSNCRISKRQLEMKINAIAVREKRPGFHKMCWYVHDSVLKEFDLSGLVSNSLIPPPEPSSQVVTPEEPPQPTYPKDQRSIMDFAKSKEELAKIESTRPKPVETITPVSKKSHLNFASPKEGQDKKEGAASMGEENLPATNSSSQDTPKANKTLPGQMSIMNFAKKGSPLGKSTTLQKKSDPEPMEVDCCDVIILDDDPSTKKAVDSTVKESMSSAVSQPNEKTSLNKNIPTISQKENPSLNGENANSEGSTKPNDVKLTTKCHVKINRLEAFKFDKL